MPHTLAISGYVFAVVFAFLSLLVFAARLFRSARARPGSHRARRRPLPPIIHRKAAVRAPDLAKGYSAEDFVNPMSPHFAWRAENRAQENDRHW